MPETYYCEWCDKELTEDQLGEGLCESCLEDWLDNGCSEDFDEDDEEPDTHA